MSLPASAGEQPSPPLIVWIGFAAMLLGNFMAMLDIQIVASAIGNIQAGVGASRDEISWVQTAYLIAEVVGIPVSGFLAKALGTRLLFCLSALMFSFASLLCAFSWDITSLLIFRAIQGFSGAAMIPLTMATVFLVVPRHMQAMAGAMVGMVTTLAPSLGPTLGGYIAETLGWRALFWINLAPGILVAITVWNALRSLEGPKFSLLRQIDVPGLAGLALFLGGAEYVLEEGPANGWFTSGELVLWALTSLAGAVLFFWRTKVAAQPIVDLRPFTTPTYAVGAMLGFVLGLSIFSTVFLTPLFLGSVRGYSALQIGENMIVQGAVMFFTAPVVGRIGRSLEDPRLFGAIGFLVVSLSCWVQSHFTADSAFWELALPQAIRGVGLIMTFSSVMQPALRALPATQVHAGAALFNTMRNLGGAFGIAAMATLHAHAFALHRQELYAAANPSNPHVQGMIAQMQAYLAQTGALDPARQALMNYANLLDREALVMTFNDQFLVMAVVIAFSSLGMAFLKPEGAPMPAHEAARAH